MRTLLTALLLVLAACGKAPESTPGPSPVPSPSPSPQTREMAASADACALLEGWGSAPEPLQIDLQGKFLFLNSDAVLLVDYSVYPVATTAITDAAVDLGGFCTVNFTGGKIASVVYPKYACGWISCPTN